MKPIISSIRAVRIIYDTLLVPGIIYRKLDVELADSAHTIVHAVTCVVRNPRYSIELLHSPDRIRKLETLPSLVRKIDSTQNRYVYLATNASYWRAATLTPIGICVSGGEVVFADETSWYSLWLDRRYRPWLDSQHIAISLQLPNNVNVPIDVVNTKASDTNTVLFNRYVGDSVVICVSKNNLESSLSTIDTVFNSQPGDDHAAKEKPSHLSISQNNSMMLLLRYLRSPSINTDVRCVVVGHIDSGCMEIPLRGCIVTYPRLLPIKGMLRIGDTVILRFRTRTRDSLEYLFAVSGTPVLVRDGRITNQLADTVYRGSAFIEQRMARTAIGTDVIQSVLYLVVVEGGAMQSSGMSLRELADFMKRFGAYSALNLDGGSSSCMIVGDRCVFPLNGYQLRPIVNAIVISRKKYTMSR